MKRTRLGAVAALVLGTAFAAVAVAGSAMGGASDKSVYIVQMADDPTVAYEGGVAGLKATAPDKGKKIDPNAPEVVKYVGYLKGKHDATLGKVGGGDKLYDYVYSYNGLAARLTGAQAASLAKQAGVQAVVPDTMEHLDTSTTPRFLGLTQQGGLWSQLSGNADGNPIASNGPNSGGAGEGVVVGVVDSGIWPENPSFSDRDATGKLIFQQIPGWNGRCRPGEAFNASNCNQKLIAAQWYNAGFGGDAGVKESFPYEFASARGADGHGSHTASTAAGNYGVDAVVDGTSLGKISGMAPRARSPSTSRAGAFRRTAAASTATAWRPSTRRSPTASM